MAAEDSLVGSSAAAAASGGAAEAADSSQDSLPLPQPWALDALGEAEGPGQGDEAAAGEGSSAQMPGLTIKPEWQFNEESESSSGVDHSGTDNSGTGGALRSAWPRQLSAWQAGSSNNGGGGRGGGHSSSSSGGDADSASSGRRPNGKPKLGALGPPVVLAGQRYDSLLDLRFHMRVLQRQLLGEAEEVEVVKGTPQFTTIQALFRRHPNYSQKVREPITSFFVVKNPYVAGGQGCEFQYIDARGKEARTDFSLLKCTKPRPPAKRNLLLEAAAAAVEGQLAELTAAGTIGPAGALLCSTCTRDFKVEPFYTGRPLSKLVQAYGDQANPARPPSKFVRVSGGQQAAFRRHSEADASWQRGWQAFHQQHARVALLCKQCQCQVKLKAEAKRREQQLIRQAQAGQGKAAAKRAARKAAAVLAEQELLEQEPRQEGAQQQQQEQQVEPGQQQEAQEQQQQLEEVQQQQQPQEQMVPRAE